MAKVEFHFICVMQKVKVYSAQAANTRFVPYRGRHRIQQDACLAQQPKGWLTPIAAVFDGHGDNAQHITQSCIKCLEKIELDPTVPISQQLAGLPKLLENEVKKDLAPILEKADWIQSQRETYKPTDFLAIDRRPDSFWDQAGSTMTAAFLEVSNTPQLWVVNLGDSRAAFYDFRGKPLSVWGNENICTTDHALGFGKESLKPAQTAEWWDAEKKRIEDEGGFVSTWGCVRLNGALAITRSLFDDIYRPLGKVADVYQVPLTEGTMILATDGVWDVLTVEEVGLILSDPALFFKAKKMEGSVDEIIAALASRFSGDYQKGLIMNILSAYYSGFGIHDRTFQPRWFDLKEAALFIVNMAQLLGSPDDCSCTLIGIGE